MDDIAAHRRMMETVQARRELDLAEEEGLQRLLDDIAAHLTDHFDLFQGTAPADSRAAAAADDLDDFAPTAPDDLDDVGSLITATPDHLDDLASRINADEGADQGAGDGAGGDHGAGYGSSHGRSPWVPRCRPPSNYGTRVVTGSDCPSQGCGRKRESEACQYCAVHCLWPEEVSWPHRIEGLCKVHWLKPHRCQLIANWCSSSAPQKPPLCDYQLCRTHCQALEGSQYCSAHGINAPPPRQRGNRTPGARHLGKDRFAPYAGPKVWHYDRWSAS